MFRSGWLGVSIVPVSKFENDYAITNKSLKNADLSCIVCVVLMNNKDFSDVKCFSRKTGI